MATPPPINGAIKPAETDKVSSIYQMILICEGFSFQKNRLQAPTTVFVGSISDRAPDAMIKRMLHVSFLVRLCVYT
jgi:hypothetical protein